MFSVICVYLSVHRGVPPYRAPALVPICTGSCPQTCSNLFHLDFSVCCTWTPYPPVRHVQICSLCCGWHLTAMLSCCRGGGGHTTHVQTVIIVLIVVGVCIVACIVWYGCCYGESSDGSPTNSNSEDDAGQYSSRDLTAFAWAARWSWKCSTA